MAIAAIMVFTLGCSGGPSGAPTLPDESASPQIGANTAPPSIDPYQASSGHELWGRYNLLINMETLETEVVPDRTSDAHYDVTWVKQICPACITVKLKNFDANTRTFWLELHAKNPSNKIGRDVRFIIDLDDTGEYDFLDPDNYTKLHVADGAPNPFRALAKQVSGRMFMPAANHVDFFKLYISETHFPMANIPFILDASYPNRCQEPYMMTDIVIDGEFPPGGGGQATVTLVAWDSQKDIGEVWLRTGGIFTASDILMTSTGAVGIDGYGYTATFSNALGGGSGLTPILIEAYTFDTAVEPFPLNDYARIFADPGGESAIAGEVFNAINKQNINGSQVKITSTSGGANPLPIDTSSGSYFQTVLAGTYKVESWQTSYFLQDTMYDVIVPPDSVVYVCFGLAPKYLDNPDEALATVSGHIRDSVTGDPVAGAQATLDGGPVTGGVIQSRTVDANGHYCFWAVPTFQQNNWTVHAFHPAYIPQDLENIPSDKNKSTPQVDFDLVSLTADAVWAESFESGPSNIGTQRDWTFDVVWAQAWPGGSGADYHNQHRDGADILWRVWDPISDPVQCIFYTNGVSQLPPDDLSGGWMPDPYEGHRFMMYAEDEDTSGVFHSGSFIDEWGGDGVGSGGTSTNSFNAGWAKTGPIDLTGFDELTLQFQTYWEIESVDPSIAYDAMDVLISTDGTAWDLLDRLNPLAEPIPDMDNAMKPYTSSGFNQAAVWAPVVLDISSYGGNSTVWLRLDFDTIDPLFNGYRGWLVDNIAIWPYTIE